KLVFTGKHLGLWLFDTKGNRPQKIDVSTYAGQGDFDSSWSPDSKWIAYKKYLKNRISAIFLFSLETGKSTRVTSGMLNCFSPVFDKNGLYLYFLKANWAGAQWDVFGMSYLLVDMDWASNLYVLPLSSKTPSPALVGEKITNNATGDITVDFTNIEERSFKLPIPERIFMRIAPGTVGTLFAYEQILPRGFTRNNLSYDLYKINTVDMKPQMFVSDINSFTVSADGRHVLYRERQTRAIVSTESAPAKNEKKLDLSKLEITVNPIQEWRHILADTCRIQKHYLYDANTHGQDLDMLEEHYAAYLPNVVTRRGLTFVLNELLSHISISHMGTGGGDALSSGRRDRVGVLGANVEIAHNRYRITKIFRGDNSRELTASPLTLSGVNGKVGEYVLAVNGNEITADKNFYSYFIGTPGKPTKLKIGPSPDGTGAREVTIVPMAGDNTLRRLDWVHKRRDMVNKLSGGRLAYIYIPNFGSSGMQMFTW
ncbi:MAG: PDZ domain-containing protein, partial [Chlorobiales bacterium]|nr:PDZ domain-containing protein [Chlorobiales bacterium]